MAGDEDQEDRTEAASAQRLQHARDEGQVAVSREVAGLVGLGVAALAFMATGPSMGRSLLGLGHILGSLDKYDTGNMAPLLWQCLFVAAAAAGPVILGILVASSAATLLQTGFLLSTKALLPDLARLDPRRGLKRIAGRETLVQAVKSVVKIGILAWLVWHALSLDIPALVGAPFWQPALLGERLWQSVLHLMLLLCGMQAVVAAADVAWTRFSHARSLRMTKQELKDENKQNDGDPHIKGRRRQMRMARARKRMMAAIPKATVVVTNPTHYAVALSYDRTASAAPRVVAKGVDEVAARIREMATQHNVPLVANPPLARALYKIELDAEIPGEHFHAVAQLIAYVWRLNGRPRA